MAWIEKRCCTPTASGSPLRLSPHALRVLNRPLPGSLTFDALSFPTSTLYRQRDKSTKADDDEEDEKE
jgi:hypothetical protein